MGSDAEEAEWQRVWQRQLARAEVIRTQLERLQLRPGDVFLDVGCGSGFVSLLAAEQVGPAGTVWAVDVAPGALAFLAARQRERGLSDARVRRLCADARTFELPAQAGACGEAEARPNKAYVGNMLHHVADPAAVVAHVPAVMRPGGRILVCEYDPAGAGRVGPPRERRIAPDAVREWLAAAGCFVQQFVREEQGSEQYTFVALVRPAV